MSCYAYDLPLREARTVATGTVVACGLAVGSALGVGGMLGALRLLRVS